MELISSPETEVLELEEYLVITMDSFWNNGATEVPYVIVTSGIALTGIWLSNLVYDLKVPNYISRKIGHGAGGLAYLIGILLFSSAFWPMVIIALFSILLLVARYLKPTLLRGIGGSGRSSGSLSELWFVWIAMPVVGVSWLWLNQPFVAATCLLFMAWGDCVTGIVRSKVYSKPCKGLGGSLAMLVVCLSISWAFISPFWIGAVASVAAVGVEWSFGDVAKLKWGDDNWAVPLFSMMVILSLMAFTGNLK